VTFSPCQNRPSLKTLSTDNRKLWCAFLPTRLSVFGSVQFVSIVERYTGYKGRLVLYTDGDEVIAYPLLLRPINELPFAADMHFQGWDSLSPEYTGPLAFGSVSPTTADKFLSHFHDYCQREGIITEFAHLHPCRWSSDLYALEDVSFDREIVYIDLSLSPDQLWRESFTHACRKNIKRALKEKVRVFEAKSIADVREFHRIYLHTMERTQALSKYHFPLDYFVDFAETMPDHARLVLAEYDNQIVAGTLYLHDDEDVYSYLGGADHTYQHVRPTNAVIYDTICWAQRQGKKRLILGGGYGPTDTIFRFKASFSPLRTKFYVYKRIHLADAYAALCRAWSAHHGDKAALSHYFPSYRATSA
jgi:serine/alanine adding enzyme